MYSSIKINKEDIIKYKKYCKYFHNVSKIYRVREDITKLLLLKLPYSMTTLGINNINLERGIIKHHKEIVSDNQFILSNIRLIDSQFIFDDKYVIMFNSINYLYDKQYIECDIKCILIGNNLIFKILNEEIKNYYPNTHINI